jgi:hypothetical protein
MLLKLGFLVFGQVAHHILGLLGILPVPFCRENL